MKGVETYFGIDFGTTNSAMAGIKKTSEGYSIIKYTDEIGGPFPSLIAIDRNTGEVFCGRKAWQQRRELSETCEVIKSVKSFLGTEKKWYIAGKEWTPELVTAHILKGLIDNAYNKFNDEMKEAIISVPVDYSAEKRKALRKAAEMVGLKVKSFVSESTTAVFKNYMKLKKFNKVVVFDWGGGTLDVSVLKLEGNKVYELNTNGINIGGDDIDIKLAKYIHTKVALKKNIDIAFDDMDLKFQDMLLVKTEMAKRELTDADSTSVTLYKYGPIGAVNIQIDIDTFSELIKPEIERATFTLEKTIREAGLSMREIDCILMVGGSSNLRPLREHIETKWSEYNFEYPEDSEWNVAEGTALLSMIPGGFKLNQNIGLKLCDGSFFPIKLVNDEVPFKKEEYSFGVVDSSKDARFIFVDNTYSKFNGQVITLGRVSVPIYGFVNELIKMEVDINEDLIFIAEIKSDRLPDEFKKKFTYSNVKFYYELPKWIGDKSV